MGHTIKEYHETHDEGMDWTCSICTVGAVLAQVEDLDRADALSTLATAAAEVWRISTRETVSDGAILAAILMAINAEREHKG
jgi:hypothetical protein